MLFVIILVCLLLNFGKSELLENSEKNAFLLTPNDELFDEISFSTTNTSIRKTNKDNFGVDAYCVLVTEIINNNIFNVQMKIFYIKDVDTMNSMISKDICLSYKTEYSNFINDLETNKYFPRTCPIVPGFYFVKSYKFDGPSISESLWNEITNNVKLMMKRSLKLQCRDYFD